MLKEVSMATWLSYANTLYPYFSSTADAHGESTILGGQRGGKVQSRNMTVRGALTREMFIRHMRGVQGYGVVPVGTNGKTRFTVIDVDEYNPYKLVEIIKMIEHYQFPIVPFETKSKGLHLYTFYKTPVSASAAIVAARALRDALMLPADTEIFPKQSKVDTGKFGNWINLPLFNGTRTPLDARGCDLTPEDGVKAIVGRAVESTQDVMEFVNNLPFNDAPPCLQSLLLNCVNRKVTDRNIILFNAAVYLQAKFGNAYKEKVLEINDSFANPLDISEIERTVFQSLDKQTYTFQCASPILKKFCNKETCNERAYGKSGHNDIPKIDFGQIMYVNTYPRTYIWTVNGQKMEFHGEPALLSQKLFRDRYLALFGRVVNPVKEAKWSAILNKAMESIKEAPEEMADEVLARDATTSFMWRFVDSTLIGTTEQDCETHNRPYYNEVTGELEYSQRCLMGFNRVTMSRYTKDELEDVTRWFQSVAHARVLRHENKGVYIHVKLVNVLSPEGLARFKKTHTMRNVNANAVMSRLYRRFDMTKDDSLYEVMARTNLESRTDMSHVYRGVKQDG